MMGLAILSPARMSSSTFSSESEHVLKARLLRQMKAIAHAVPARKNKKAITDKYFELAKRYLGSKAEQ